MGGAYLEVFNRGQSPFTFAATVNAPWIILSEWQGRIEQEKRIGVSVDWTRAPLGLQAGSITIAGSDDQVVRVKTTSFRPAFPKREELQGFVQGGGYVAIEAPHYSRKLDQPSAQWERLEDLGREDSAMTVFPVTAESRSPGRDAPCLEYEMYLFDAGLVRVEAIFDPTLNFVPGRGLRYAIAFDDEPPQVIDLLADRSTEAWATSVKDSVRKSTSTHTIAARGYHRLKVWMVDPGVPLQKLVVDLGGVKPSYLGPPESFHSVPREQGESQRSHR